MSKMRFVLLLLFISAFCLVSSCSNEDDYLLAGDWVAASFVPTMDDLTDASTRVVNNTWSGTEIVGINMVAAGGNLAANATFNQYKAASAGTSVTLSPNTADQTLYYPVDGSNVNFFAFSPYKAPSSNQVTYSATDQNTQGKLEAVDFIWTKATGTYNKKNPTVNMIFAHKQSKVIVKVTAGTGVTVTDMATGSAALTMGTMPCGGTYNLSDGNLAGSITTGSIDPYKNTTLTTTTSVTWEAIVPPHSGANYTSRSFAFTFNGKSYTYTLPTADNYVAGFSYTYDLTLTTSGVALQSTTVSNWTGGATSWGGKYVLHTTSSTLNFSPAASSQTLTIQYQGTSTAPVAVTSTSATNSAAGAVSWLTASVAGTTTTSAPWTERVLTVTTTANTGTGSRTGYIHVSLEGLSVVITVVQNRYDDYTSTDGLSNCYMVAPGGSIAIPVTRAVTLGGASSSATFTAAKLWDDTSGSAVASCTINGTGSSAFLVVTAGSSSGNALIAVQVGTTTYWSYHIWVTDYNPWQGATYTNTLNTNKNGANFVFMDRNLGATFAGMGSGIGTGLFYQWGRKDPFPSTLSYDVVQPGGGKFTAEATTETKGTIANTIKYPAVFYTATSTSGYDWYWGTGSTASDRNNTLWGHGNTTGKSVYDPCPAGWRVPSHNVAVGSYSSFAASPWGGFGDGSNLPINLNPTGFANGYTWGANALYPAAGLRDRGSGALGSVSSHGFVWSASPSSSTSNGASYLSFYSGYVGVSNNGNRAYGFSVRCVRE